MIFLLNMPEGPWNLEQQRPWHPSMYHYELAILKDLTLEKIRNGHSLCSKLPPVTIPAQGLYTPRSDGFRFAGFRILKFRSFTANANNLCLCLQRTEVIVSDKSIKINPSLPTHPPKMPSALIHTEWPVVDDSRCRFGNNTLAYAAISLAFVCTPLVQ